jgi:flagellar basal body-associated protein FliL
MAVLRFAIKQEAVVEGNGNGNAKKKRRRRIIIWSSIAAVVVVLAVAGGLIASSGGTKIDPSKLAKVERGDLAKSVVATGQDRAHHQGRDQVKGQRHREEALRGLWRQGKEGAGAGRTRQG